MPSKSPIKECEVFLNFLYGKESGWVYAPVKTAEQAWVKHWFQWPDQRENLISHVLSNSVNDVYIGPALFESQANALVTNVRGSNVVWADFDGNAPTAAEIANAKLPQPALRVQSSITGHEHVYWKLSAFETDVKTFQDINKNIAYVLDADLSGWDASQVLRPVGSVNHKRGGATATVISFKETNSDPAEFSRIPSIEKVHFDEVAFRAMGKVPPMLATVYKYTWTQQEINILHREESRPGELTGKRGRLLFRLASICAEKGMPDTDIYAIISGKDKRPGWHKFSERSNPERAYIRLIDKVRQSHPYRSEADKLSGFDRVTFNQHFDEDNAVEYILEGYIAPNSLNIIMGKSTSGKTNFAMHIARSLALGKDVMRWKNVSGKCSKMLYLSYEMNRIENRLRFEDWAKHYNEAEIRLIDENLITFYPSNDPVRFYVLADQARIMALIEVERPGGIIIDSASLAIAPNMTDEESAKTSIEFIKNLIKRYNIFVILIHHPRKSVPGSKAKDTDVDETHGAQVIINQATTAVTLSRIFFDEMVEAEKLISDISWRKNRLGATPPTFRVELQADLTFREFGEPKAITTSGPPKALPPARSSGNKDILSKLAEKNTTSKKPKKTDEF